MPTTVNHTIDDISPLISYTGSSWHESTPALDPLISQYSNDTFTLCNTAGSYATFSFNGTAIWIFGAKRPNHAPYSVTLDGVTTPFDGHADPAVFQTPLFGATNLPTNQIHTVTITNQEDDPTLNYLDIDFITWTSVVADPNAPTTVVRANEDAAFSFHPPSAWSNTTIGTSTSSQQASAVLTFEGDEVTLYGAVGPNSGPYTISIDDGPPSTHNASKINATDQVPLYYASNLGAGTHTLNISNAGPETSTLGIDYAVMRGHSPTSAGGKAKSGLTTGAIAGIAVGAAAAITAFFILVLLWHRRRRRQREQFDVDADAEMRQQLTAGNSNSNTGRGRGRGRRGLTLTPFVLGLQSQSQSESTSWTTRTKHSIQPQVRVARGDVEIGERPPDYQQVVESSTPRRPPRIAKR